MQPLRVSSDFCHNGQHTNSYAHKLDLYFEGAIIRVFLSNTYHTYRTLYLANIFQDMKFPKNNLGIFLWKEMIGIGLKTATQLTHTLCHLFTNWSH